MQEYVKIILKSFIGCVVAPNDGRFCITAGNYSLRIAWLGILKEKEFELKIEGVPDPSTTPCSGPAPNTANPCEKV